MSSTTSSSKSQFDCYFTGGWRNGLVFDPLKKYGQWSYADFFLYPLADALAQSMTASTKVRFSTQVSNVAVHLFLMPLQEKTAHIQPTDLSP